MSIKQLKNGRFKLDFYASKGNRIVRVFSSYDEALAFQQELKEKVKDGYTVTAQKETLQDIINLWFYHFGQALKSGTDRYKMLSRACKRMGNPLVNRFTKRTFLNYRAERLGMVSNNTLNHELSYFNAMFEQLRTHDLYHFKNPVKGIKRLRVDEKELGYLSPDEIRILLNALKKRKSQRAYVCAKICLMTGCRFGEAEKLNLSCFNENMIVFKNTKNSRVRYVPVPDDFLHELKEFLKREPLTGAYSTFKVVFRSLKLQVPKGQMSHVLRHSFASHYLMNGGDLFSLQKILGHSDMKMTLRYSHFTQDYLSQATELNPLTYFNIS